MVTAVRDGGRGPQAGMSLPVRDVRGGALRAPDMAVTSCSRNHRRSRLADWDVVVCASHSGQTDGQVAPGVAVTASRKVQGWRKYSWWDGASGVAVQVTREGRRVWHLDYCYYCLTDGSGRRFV